MKNIRNSLLIKGLNVDKVGWPVQATSDKGFNRSILWVPRWSTGKGCNTTTSQL